MGNLFSKFTSSGITATAPEKMSPPPFSHYPSAQTEFKPPLISPPNHYLGDILSSGPSSLPFPQKHLPHPDTMSPITAGFYHLDAGPELVYEYTYHEMKIVVDGVFEISDETGQTAVGRKGDVFYFPKGSKIRFRTETGGTGFFVGQRGEGTA